MEARLNSWHSETIQEKLACLRVELKGAQDQLIEAEAELADELADVKAFEQEYDARVGSLEMQLHALEAELHETRQRLQRQRNLRELGADHVSVEEQYRQTWEAPRRASAQQDQEAAGVVDEKEVKRLYRKLARRFHPDLTSDAAERAYRTEKMAALNDAYAARSMAEMVALANEPEPAGFGETARGLTDQQMVQTLEEELSRVKRRIRAIRFELSNLHNRPSVQLSLDAKFAARNGRDVLGEMASEVKKKIMFTSAQLQQAKAQFETYGT